MKSQEVNFINRRNCSPLGHGVCHRKKPVWRLHNPPLNVHKPFEFVNIQPIFMHRVSCLPRVRADHKCTSILPGGFCTVQEEEE